MADGRLGNWAELGRTGGRIGRNLPRVGFGAIVGVGGCREGQPQPIAPTSGGQPQPIAPTSKLVRRAQQPAPLTAATAVAMYENELGQKAVKISAVDAAQGVVTVRAGVLGALIFLFAIAIAIAKGSCGH